MPEFNLIPVARSSPTECFLCKTFEGPFVDTAVEKIEGRVLLCASKTGPDGQLDRSGCIEQMARLVGMVDKEVHAEALRMNDVLSAHVAELDAADKGPTLVSGDDFVDRVTAAIKEQQRDMLDAVGGVAAAVAELDVKRKK
jgi:hypothetical protein